MTEATLNKLKILAEAAKYDVPRHIIATSVYAICAVIHAHICKHNLKQRYATAVIGKTVA